MNVEKELPDCLPAIGQGKDVKSSACYCIMYIMWYRKVHIAAAVRTKFSIYYDFYDFQENE